MWEEGENVPIKIDLLTSMYGIFLINDCYAKAQLTMGGVTPQPVVLDSTRKQAEKARSNKPVSHRSL